MKESLFWKIEKEGCNTGYLLGTMHVKSKRVFIKITEIEQKIQEVDCFAAEYHLDKVKFVQKADDLLIPNGEGLSDILGLKKFHKLNKMMMKAFKVDLRPFEHYLPLLMVNIIAESILSNDYNLPLDLHLWEIAKKNEKQLKGLETYESQKRIMNNIALKDQIKMLKEIGRNPSKYRKAILLMGQLYEQSEIKLLYIKGKKSLGKYKHILLTRRNEIMAKRIDQILKEESCFFAIGAGHLAGAKGVLKLLKSLGWKLEAL